MARILIVEDNDMNWDMLSRRLERRGYQVSRALDGREGANAAQTRPPDLILMDMGLPVMDGWEATRVLKGAPATRGIPIIGLTAHAMAEDRQKVMDAGCDDYETKPLDLARLLVKIETLLKGTTSA
jgi:CheY-like chemotaxis protein